MHLVLRIIRIGVPILAAGWLFTQVRRPTGWLGRRVTRAMNIGHARLTDWGLRQVRVPDDARILDVGCGGGRTIGKLAQMVPNGKVFGLDLSPASVDVARETNRKEVDAGRVHIQQGSVSTLPFPDGTFDLVTAVETHYYWPDLPNDVREVARVLKRGGTFLLIAETYRGGPLRLLYGLVMPLLRAAFLTDEQHRELLTQAGLTEVTTLHLPRKNWICALGRKAS
jgi:SAM-dependent methyltransferase